jgi:NAD(P)-dependent dehydrogenase (short-subunit alcohol dehydrogenase family)
MRLEGKIAIITGGASGLGEAMAIRFAEEGAKVSIVDVDKAGGERAVEAISAAGGTASFSAADISNADGARAAVLTTVDRYGGLDVLVNNAGISAATIEDSWSVGEEEWDRMMAVNLKGVYLCSKYAIPEIKKRGGGAIVNTASIAGTVAVGGSHYAASKGAVVMITKTLAVELARDNIRVNAVGPGFMITPMSTGVRNGMNEAEQKARLEGFAANVPAGRCGEPVEVANTALFLASDEASYVTGQLICVDGGFTAV